jgi:hypothetical protein
MISYALLAALLALIGYRVASVWAGHALVSLLPFP